MNKTNRAALMMLGAASALVATPALAAPEPQDAGASLATTETDPARLAAAQVTVDYLFPLGTYQRMMKGTMDQLMDSILSQTFDRPVAETMKGYGVDDAAIEEMGEFSPILPLLVK